MQRPLAGLRVLDLTIFLSGPFCTQLLAGLGADVIKVERPGSGDPARANPPYADAGGIAFDAASPTSISLSILKRNRNKRSITLNLKTGKGKDIFKEMVRSADVVVENFSPGTMDGLGVGYDVLSAINPRLVYCSISGFGQDGPYRDRAAFDLIIQAMSGFMAVTGFSDGPPVRTDSSIGDLVASLYAAIGILAALRFRDETGKGQMIDVSMLDSVFSFVFDEAKDVFARLGIPARTGNHRRRLTPFGIFEAKDGHVAICTASDDHCHKLFRHMGREDLCVDADSCTLAARYKNPDRVNAAVEEWTRSRSKADIVAALIRLGLPCGPVVSIEEVTSDPQLMSREMTVGIEHPLFGPVEGVIGTGMPIKLSQSPGYFDRPAPLLGQDDEDVYREVLGYGSEYVARLRAEGVI